MADRVLVTHLSITLEGDVDARNEVARRAVIMARTEGEKRGGVRVSVMSAEEFVHDAIHADGGSDG